MKNLIGRPRSIASLLTVVLAIGVQDGSYSQSPVEGKIYWTEARDLGWIQRADLDGANVESVLTTEIQTGLQMAPIFLLAVDSFAYKIYWTEWDRDPGSSTKSTIRRADLDGGNVETLVTREEHISAIALDWFGGKMYWAEWGTTIQRADLDGSNVETLITGIEGYVSGIALDAYVWTDYQEGEPASKMYWAEYDTGTIRWADLDGSNIETLITGIENPTDIALYGLFLDIHFVGVEPKMYWADNAGTIRWADLDGSNVETLIAGEREWSRTALALDWDYGILYWTEWDWEEWRGIFRWADWDGLNVEVITEIDTEIAFTVDSFKGGTLYWSEWDSSTIQRSSPGSLHQGPISLGMEGPGSIALDVDVDMMYWVDKRTRSIRRADLDVADVEELVTGVEDAKDIALDLDARRMYWTEQSMGAIRRADLDGADVETLVTGIGNPEGIALDILAGKMYWTAQVASRFLDSGVIQRSNLDGSNVETLVAGLRDPVEIALDHVAGKMYCYSLGSGSIYRANFDGSSGEVLAPRLKGPVEIVLDIVDGKMYWAEREAGVIRRSDLDGANVEEVVTGLVRPVGIALDVPPPATPPHTAPISRTVVEATVQGASVESLTIEFARTISTSQPYYAWSAVTDAVGRLALNITSRDAAGVSGFYEARARNEAGEIVGQWDDILLNDGLRHILELTLGGGVRVVAVERLRDPNPDPCSNGIAVPDPTVNRGLVEDCRALLSLRDLWGWSDYPRWSAAIPIDSWTGVDVRNSRVSGIAIIRYIDIHGSDPCLSGPLSSELSRLTALEALRFPKHCLEGPIPPELGQLTQLTTLDLYDNYLTGPIPPELGQLTQLERLHLGNQLTGPIPPELGQLTQLKALSLDGRLTGPIPPELGQLTQLERLHLGGNQLTGPIPPELGQLTQLKALDLQVNRLTGPIPPELGQLTQLERLYLGGNQLTGPIPPELGQLTQLEWLYLDGNQFTCVPEALAKWAEHLPICETTASTATAADFDGDGVTDFADFFLFADHFGSSDARFDFDSSGAVDFADFFLFADHFDPSARAKLVALARELIGLPDSSQLQQNAPNPFNSETVISYFLLEPGPARVEVFSLTGQRVAILHQGPQQAGYHRLRWNGRDDAGRPLASGMYLYRLVTAEGVLTRKLILLR